MHAEEAIEELALSFARNGYFWEEPLVVVPAQRAQGKFVVVEGNRRLAALKLLLDPSLRRRLKVADFPSISSERQAELQAVPTVLYESRDQVVPYLGFRHITGVKTWEPYAKARYVADLIAQGRPIADIEQTIGDSASTVKKLYQAYVLFKQIIDELGADPKEIRSGFSLLEVLLGQQAIKEFLGVARKLPTGPIERVVPSTGLDDLRDVVSWVFGNRSQGLSRIISDSRQIPQRLAPIVADPEALAHLRQSRDLEGAYERSGGEREYLIRQLTLARRALERALGVAPLHTDDETLITHARDLATLLESLLRSLRQQG
jgi:hypothetical protein